MINSRGIYQGLAVQVKRICISNIIWEMAIQWLKRKRNMILTLASLDIHQWWIQFQQKNKIKIMQAIMIYNLLESRQKALLLHIYIHIRVHLFHQENTLQWMIVVNHQNIKLFCLKKGWKRLELLHHQHLILKAMIIFQIVWIL